MQCDPAPGGRVAPRRYVRRRRVRPRRAAIGFGVDGADCLIIGAGGVGSAIAAALAAEGPGSIALFDIRDGVAEALAMRLRRHYPAVRIRLGGNDPAGFQLVVNATPLGMIAGDKLPFD